MNIALFLEMAAESAGDRTALVCEGRRWSFAALLNAARGASTLITESHSEFVALLDESSEASVIAMFGAAFAGIPYCPLNYRLPDVDVAALLERIAPAYVVGDAERLPRLTNGASHVICPRADFVRAAQQACPPSHEGYVDGDSVAIQLFTSGTTASPKAAILSHSNLVSYILGTVEFGAAADREAALVSVPPYHIAGIAAIASSIYAQRRIVMLPSFDPDAWLKLVEEERVTNAFTVPTMLSRVIQALEHGGTADISSLRAIAYGGGKMPLALIRRALGLLPDIDFTNAYGLTETSSTITLLGPEDHRLAYSSLDRAVSERLASVGRPLSTVELEVRDENGCVLLPGQVGEIYVRGSQVSGQYQNRSALDGEGWFPTRDTGYLDSEGYLFLAGRADDVIVRGGENISPGEVEDVLLTHAAIADAAAVAVQSAEWGEEVGIAVVVRDGHAQPEESYLRELIHSRLRSTRVPAKIIFLPHLPYNVMGKLIRREVKMHFECDCPAPSCGG